MGLMTTDRNRTVLIAAFVVVASAVQAPAQIPLGAEFRVDTRGSVDQYSSFGARTIAMAPDGSYIVVWVESNHLPFPNLDLDVVARRYDATGAAYGPDFVVNTSTTGLQYTPSVGIDDSGNFVVAWAETSAFQGVRAQRFDATGVRRGAEFVVRDSAAGSGGARRPSVAMAPGGEFSVIWQESAGPSVTNVIGQSYDASGLPVGAEFGVNNATTDPDSRVPVADADQFGNFVVVWMARSGPSSKALGRRFAPGGVPRGAEFVASSNPTGPEYLPSVASGRDGSFVVAWAEGSPHTEILARRFDTNGVPLGGDFRIDEYTTASARVPKVDVDADGDIVITWQSAHDGSGTGIFARRFDSAGAPTSSEFRVNTYTSGTQSFAGVAGDPAGNFVVTWLSEGQNGVDGVFAQRYAGGLSAAALEVDGSAGPTSDGNGVFEAGETVAVAPSWLNANFGAETFTGAASSFTGPGAPGDPTYTVADGAASYGTVASGATGTCTAAGDCYALRITVPSVRPAPHWDGTFREEISPANLGAVKTWALHVGDSFADVPRASGFYQVRGDGAAPRHHRGLQPHSVLPRRLDDPRADGGVRPRREGRPG